MSSFKSKFASLVQDLRNKKSKEFSRQPQPAYSEHYAEAPPPPPPIPEQYRQETKITAGAPSKDKSDRPPSRSGSILRKIGSKTSLRELRRKSSFAGKSSTSVNNYGLQNDGKPAPTAQESQGRQQSVELTPPPSAGKRSPPPINTSVSQYTPPSAYEDPEDDLYSDPVKDKQKADAAKNAVQSAGPVAAAPDPPRPAEIIVNKFNPPQRPVMFIPGTNSHVLPTIPASPASIMASPTSPTGTNPFRKFSNGSPKIGDGTFNSISPVLEQKGFESPTLNTQVPPEISHETASPTTATRGLMNGLNFSFAPPPIEAPPPPPTTTQITPPTSTHSSPVTIANNNPFKDLMDDSAPGPSKQTAKAILPPGSNKPPVTAGVTAALERSPSGKAPQYKRAPSGKASIPANFAPPPPPPAALPHGWTARWDEKEQKFAYYQGTKGRTEQWEMPTEPAQSKKLSMRDRRMQKKKEVQDSVASMPRFEEGSSPTAEPRKAPAAISLVAPNPSG